MTSIRQGSKTSAADRALIVAQIDGLVSGGMSVWDACLEVECKFVNYYRWKSEAAKALIPSAPKEKKQAGRKAKFELREAETRRLRFWRLVKGSIPLAVLKENEQGGKHEQTEEPDGGFAASGRRGGDVLKGVFHDQPLIELVATLLCLS